VRGKCDEGEKDQDQKEFQKREKPMHTRNSKGLGVHGLEKGKKQKRGAYVRLQTQVRRKREE